MSNDVLIIVRSEDHTDPGFNSARAKGRKLADDLEKDARQSSKKIGKTLGDGIGDGLNMAASDISATISTTVVPGAEKAGKEAGDKLGDGIVKGADGRLRDAKSRFVAAGAKIGESLGESAGQSASKSLMAGAPQWAAPATAIGLTMAPVLGSILAGAVVGGAGMIGIAGGLLVASRDPAVKAAGMELKDQIGGDLKEAAVTFLPAALDSIGRVRTAWKAVLPDVKAIFTDSAKLAGPLVDGLTGMLKNLTRGIRSAVGNAEEPVAALGRLFEGIGDSIGNMFEELGENAEDGADGIDELTTAVTSFIDLTTKVVGGLSDIHSGLETVDQAIDAERYRWERLIPFLDATADGYEKNSTAAQLYRDGVIGAAGSTNDYAHYIMKQAEASKAAAGATEEQTSALKELADEMNKQTDPLFALIEGQETVTKAQKEHNKAIEKFGKNSPEAREAMVKLGKAAFDLSEKAGEAAGGFNGKLTPAMRTALRNAGLTAPQIDKLEKELRAAAKAARAWEGTFSQTYETHFKQFGKPYSQDGVARGQVGGLAHGGISGAAAGPVSSGLTWVGEAGPELLQLPPGSAVRSTGDSMRAVAQGGSGMGTDQPVVIVLQLDGQTIARATLPSLQKINRVEYAGDVTRMFPATR